MPADGLKQSDRDTLQKSQRLLQMQPRNARRVARHMFDNICEHPEKRPEIQPLQQLSGDSDAPACFGTSLPVFGASRPCFNQSIEAEQKPTNHRRVFVSSNVRATSKLVSGGLSGKQRYSEYACGLRYV